MSKPTTPNKQLSWSEINKAKKEAKRKWKEENLAKKMKKEKLSVESAPAAVETAKPQELSTLSIAVPGSILENAQSLELRTYLAGQIARAACIFQVDEIIVFDDYGDEANARKRDVEDDYGLKTMRECCVQFGRILQYMECPQYLRKHFFPIHHHLKYSGVLNPLNAPHHLSKDDVFEFREGIVTEKPVKHGSLVNVGLLKEVYIDRTLTPGIRCTVRLLPQQEGKKKLKGVVVSPTTPRSETGIYWGYTIRLAKSLNQVFAESPYKNGYDLTVGTSDKGESVDDFVCPSYQHLLVMFGGLNGLEGALENDSILNVDEPRLLFDHYLNTLPNQGSKTIRTEEAVLISLAALRNKLNPSCGAKVFEGNIAVQDNSIGDSNNGVLVNDGLDRFD